MKKQKKSMAKSGRIDLRADRKFIERLRKQAKRQGLTLSAYITGTLMLILESDERSDGLSSIPE